MARSPTRSRNLSDIMCGRYCFSAENSDDKIRILSDIMERNYPGAYKTGEIFPGDAAPAIIEKRGRIVPVPAIFGFPGFQGSRLLINARAETAAEKKTFAACLNDRRVILPATGFYEWSRDSQKVKYMFTVDFAPVMYLCGLYQIIEGQYRFVILTRAANASMEEIHNRMPVIVRETEVRLYLTDRSAAKAILESAAPTLNRRRCDD